MFQCLEHCALILRERRREDPVTTEGVDVREDDHLGDHPGNDDGVRTPVKLRLLAGESLIRHEVFLRLWLDGPDVRIEGGVPALVSLGAELLQHARTPEMFYGDELED